MEVDYVSKRSVKQENEYNNYSKRDQTRFYHSNIFMRLITNLFFTHLLFNKERVKVEMKPEKIPGNSNLFLNWKEILFFKY